MSPDIKIRTVVGSAIKTYAPSIIKIRSQVLSDSPCVSVDNVESESDYLDKMSRIKEAVAIVVFDGPKLIGASTAVPLDDQHPLFQQPIVDHNLNPSEFFYFGVSALLKEYRGRGIGHHFFELRESHIRHLKRYKKICFTSCFRPELSNPGQIPLDTFWKKRGFVEHKELAAEAQKNTPHLSYWIKSL